MSSLRRDLFERRLWPIAAILLLAIVAAPFLLLHRGHSGRAVLADASAPVPAAARTDSTSQTTRTSAPRRPGTVAASQSRDPFAGAAGGTSTTSSATGTSSAGSSSTGSSSTSAAGSTSGSGGASSTPAASGASTSGSSTQNGSASAGSVVALSAHGDSSPTSSSSGTGVDGSAGSSGSAATHLNDASGSTATSPSGTSHASSQTPRSWTVYGVNVHISGSGGQARTISDVPRFTPLPAASWPKVMFVGTTEGGRSAVFALGAGVSATGRGDCRPAHDQCALVSLAEGRSETVRWPYRADQERSLTITVTRVTKRVLHDRAAAQAAETRRSQVGLCELQLGAPIEYRYDAEGALQPVTDSTPACTSQMRRHAPVFHQAGWSGTGTQSSSVLGTANVTGLAAQEAQ